MPHSGGGGSHGGGSHGGSHGSHHSGSSARRSHHYFPGSKRYRRHYHDGRDDEYFYSDVPPRKNSIFSIIVLLIFGFIFSGAFYISEGSSSPKKLSEHYSRPQTRVIDNIDVITDKNDLEAALAEYNDITGICPVVYTMYTDEINAGSGDLEAYAYDKYLEFFDDEQHYLIVYAIPADQRDAFLDRSLRVPDYKWEIMIGDETDNLYRESRFVTSLQSGLEAGKNPGEAIAISIRDLGQYDKDKLSTPFFLSKAFLVAAVIFGLFFLFPTLKMFINYMKEKKFDYEEVPLEYHDIPGSSAIGNGSYVNGAPQVANVAKASSIFVIIFLIPFIIIGISVFVSAIALLKTGGSSGMFMLFFSLIWNSSIILILIKVLTAFKQSGANILPKKTPEDEPERSYQAQKDPQYDYDPVYDNRWPSHDDCKADHYDDDDNSLKGFE